MSVRRMLLSWPVAAFALSIVALVFAACSDSERVGLGCGQPSPDPPDAEGNLFVNPGFEDGADPWFSMDSWGTNFSVSGDRARSGANSAYLRLRSEDPPFEPVRVYGVVQELCPETFPQVVRGHYFVDRWEKGTPIQYLQFVAIVLNADNIPAEVAPATNHQVRYILAGVDRQPTVISNARYRMVTTEPPKQGEWVEFEFNLRDDFEELWGDAPEGYDNISFFFEARWDDRAPTDGISAADVYYDDLYLGAAAGAGQ